MTNPLPETKAQLTRLTDTLLDTDRPAFTLRPARQEEIHSSFQPMLFT